MGVALVVELVEGIAAIEVVGLGKVVAAVYTKVAVGLVEYYTENWYLRVAVVGAGMAGLVGLACMDPLEHS